MKNKNNEIIKISDSNLYALKRIYIYKYKKMLPCFNDTFPEDKEKINKKKENRNNDEH